MPALESESRLSYLIRMRILHILGQLRYSGAEMMLRSAAPTFLKDHDATILCTGEQCGDFAPELEAAGYEIVHIPFAKSPKFFGSVRKLILNGSFDLVHIHTERASVWYSIIVRSTGAASVRTIHNEFYFEGALRQRRAIGRKVAALSGTCHVACSPSVQRNELDRFGLKAEVINNWMDPNRLPDQPFTARLQERLRLGLASDSLVCVSIANEALAKNLRTLFEGVALAASEGLPVKLLHCGSIGPELEAFAQQTGVIVPLGTVSNLNEYLVSSDVFLSTSFNEGGQISLLEAAGAGLNCITTKVGLAEMFEDRAAVRFIDPTPGSLRDALKDIALHSPSERGANGAALAQWARQYFVPERGAREYIALYERQRC